MSGGEPDDSDEESPLGGIDAASLLANFDGEEDDSDDVQSDIEAEVQVLEPDDAADDERHEVDFDAASLLSLDESTSAVDEDTATDAGAFGVDVLPEDDARGDDEPEREAPVWFEPQLPPMDGSTDGEEALPMEQELASFGDEGLIVPWGAERYDADVLAIGSALPRSIAVANQALYFAGADIGRLALDASGAGVELLYGSDALPNQLVSIVATTREILGCPAGPQLVAWSAEAPPRRLPWPAPPEQSRGSHHTRLHSDGTERCWLVTPSGHVLYSADAAANWKLEPPRNVLAVAGSGPIFALSIADDTLRVWAQDDAHSPWKRLPLKTPVTTGETSRIQLAACGEQVALFTPRAGLRVSTSGGVEFHAVSGCSDVIGLAYDVDGALLAVLAPPSSDSIVVARVAPGSGEAVRVAELPGPAEEEPELDAMTTVGRVVYAVGNFGLVRFAPCAGVE